jgi:Zn-dependent protease with chaperone function
MDPVRFGSLGVFLLLLAPGLGAMAWFVSAAFHLSEPGSLDAVCSLDHAGLSVCVDALFFATFLLGVFVTALTHRWWRSLGTVARSPTPMLPPDDPASVRLRAVAAEHPDLRRLIGRLWAVRESAQPIFTRGLLWPRIFVSRALIEGLDREGLSAALLHEAEHVAARDPLRYLLASVSLALNPCGFLLRKELRRWRAAREALCDEGAVHRQADPLALAGAILMAVRLSSPSRSVVMGLGGAEGGLLRLRVHRLLSYTSGLPTPAATFLLKVMATVLVVGLVAMPHVLDAWPLDVLHRALEHAVGFFVLV